MPGRLAKWLTVIAAAFVNFYSAPVRRCCLPAGGSMLQQRVTRDLVGVLGDVFRNNASRSFWSLVLCSDATSLIGMFCSSMRTMLECRSAYIVTSAGSERRWR